MRRLNARSLRVRLLAALLGVTGLIWLGAAWWSYQIGRASCRERV